ncbi:hypothetical protein [Methylobacterium oxalidis]|uniref:hypothetical protein n=1 Tax=Methylobacterium oxalidis TaxID=944322 RepID=UPI003315E3F4
MGVDHYRQEIRPQVRAGRCTLVVAHGNSLRALVMHLDGLSARDVVEVHLATSQMLVYRFDAQGAVTTKQSILVDVCAT